MSEMRDIKFAKKKARKNTKPFALAGPPPMPPLKTQKLSRTFLALIWIVIVVALVGGGTYALRHGIVVRSTREKHEAATASFNLTGWFDSIKNTFSTYGALKEVSGAALDTLTTIDAMRKEVPDFLLGKTTDLPVLLASLKAQIGVLRRTSEKLVASDPEMKNNFPFFGDYFSFSASLDRGEAAIEGLETWLRNPAPHHLIVVLGNTSELRPGGGFIGSFGDIEVASLPGQGGTVRSVTIHDVNEVDRGRDAKTVPPLPLQAITARWRMADANWFFDYPTSAKKVLQFMSESDAYATSTLDGVVALTPKVFEDILAVTGPLTLSDGRTIDAKNVIVAIQSDVQAGQAEGAVAPKAVLSELAPVLIQRLGTLNDEAEKKILAKSAAWIGKKDMMIYFKDEKLQALLQALNADGSLYLLPQRFSGDYLAVVDANIGGAKTDYVMEEHVVLESHIDEAGTVHDTMTITREHHGNTHDEWWYRAENWNYLMLFTPREATLEGVEGVGKRFITPKADYHKGFANDKEVTVIEKTLLSSEDGKIDTFGESGRNVFATWQRVPAGLTKVTKISYARALPRAPYDGMPYDLVFEKQAGSHASVTFTLVAPIGFAWEYAGGKDPVYKYEDDDPQGRVIIHLTLRKI